MGKKGIVSSMSKSTKKSKLSNGGISKISLNTEEEEMLIRLISMLDYNDENKLNSISSSLLTPAKVIEGNSSSSDNSSNYSDSVDSDDSDSDEEIEQSNSDIIPKTIFSEATSTIMKDKKKKEENLVEISPSKPLLNLNAIARKLIRDDRLASKCDAVDRQVEKQAKISIIKNTGNLTSKTITTTLSNVAHSNVILEKDLPVQYKKISNLPSSIRFNVSCEAKKGVAKLIIIDRTQNIDSIIQLFRQKFNVTKKYNIILNSITKEELNDYDLTNIKDEIGVILSVKSYSNMKLQSNNNNNIKVIDFVDEIIDEVAEISINNDEKVKDNNDNNNNNDDNNNNNNNNKEIIENKPLKNKKNKQYSVWTPPETIFDHQNSFKSPIHINKEESLKMKHNLNCRIMNSNDISIDNARKQLPIFSIKQDILDTIDSNPIMIISGETGSGKTTQIPTFILDDMIEKEKGTESYIICTQPRRIAAISIAERVSYERGEKVGQSIGYQVRLNARISDHTRVLYCTTGILLRKLQQPDFLSNVSHIVVDEVHERQVDTDFLMTLLKQKYINYPKLRLVFMSATLQEGLFSKYFGDAPIIYVKGRMFPVEQHYLPDILKLVAYGQREIAKTSGKNINCYDDNMGGVYYKNSKTNKKIAGNDGIKDLTNHLNAGKITSLTLPRFDPDAIAELIIRIIQTYGKRNRSNLVSNNNNSRNRTSLYNNNNNNNNNEDKGDAILVFLSGISSIQKVNRALRQRSLESMNAQVLILHSSLPPEQQKKVFKSTKFGEWKIVLSTNIAETSVTVDDVTHVVDCGLMKEMRYDPISNISSLQEVVISRSSARQRSGRAGRVKLGHCWKVYTEDFFNGSKIDEYPIPEIRRIPLEEVVLQVLFLKLGIPEIFLGECLEPPSMNQIRGSVRALLDIKAILPLPTLPLTALGYHLAKIPVDIKIGKMLIISCLLNCVDPILTIAASLGGRTPFLSNLKNDEKINIAHKYFIKDDKFSDHLAIVNAYNEWNKIYVTKGKNDSYIYSRNNYLSQPALEDIKKLREQFRQYLIDAGFLISSKKQNIDNEDNYLNDIEIDIENIEDENELGLDNLIDNMKDQNVLFKDLISNDSNDNDINKISRCALCAGLYPQLVRVSRFDNKDNHSKRGKGRQDLQPLHIMQADGSEVFIHPMSLNHKNLPSILEDEEKGIKTKDAYIVYHTKVSSSKLFLHDCTSIPVLALLLFGGDLNFSRTSKNIIVVGGWIELKISELHAVLYKRLRNEMENMLITKIENPEIDLSLRQSILVKVISTLMN